MATAEIGALRVRLGMDAGEFSRGARAAEGALSRLDRSVREVSGKVTKNLVGLFAIDRIVQGFVDKIREVINASEQLRRLSESSGVGVEALSRLSFAAEKTGVPFETLQKVIEQFGARLTEMAANPTSKGAIALQAMGVSARTATGDLRSIEQLLPELANKFASYSDGVNKSAIASALFGEEGGPKMARLLSQGSAGLKAFGDESDRLRLTITPDAAAKMKVFEEASKSLERSSRSLAMQMATGLAPALQQVAAMFDQLTRGAPKLDEISTDKLNQRLVGLEENAARLNAQINDPTVARGLKSRQEEELSRTQRQIMLTHDLLRARALLARPVPAEGSKPNAPDLAAEIEARKRAVEGAALSAGLYNQRLREEAEFIEGLRTPYEEHEAALQRIQALLNRSPYLAKAAGRAVEQANLNAAASYAGMASQAAGHLQTLFKDSKAVSIAAAIASTAEAVIKTLAQYGYTPVGVALAGLAAAAGAAQIAAIRSAQPSGGGSAPRASGGGGAASSAAANSSTQAPSRSFMIQGYDPAMSYAGRQLEGLVGAINEFVKDGGYLVSTQNVRV